MYRGFRDDEQLSGRGVVFDFVVSSVKCQILRTIVRSSHVRAVRTATNGSSTRSENKLKVLILQPFPVQMYSNR